MFSKKRAVFETTWKKYGGARQATDHNITWHMPRKFKITGINR
jgi:hypothetical protein